MGLTFLLGSNQKILATALILSTLLLRMPHRVFSAYLTFTNHDPAFRSAFDLRSALNFMGFFLVVPFAIIAGAFLFTGAIRLGLIALMAILAVANAQHMAGQHYGIAAIYRRLNSSAPISRFKSLEYTIYMVLSGALLLIIQFIIFDPLVKNSTLGYFYRLDFTEQLISTLKFAVPILTVTLGLFLIRLEFKSKSPSIGRVWYLIGLCTFLSLGPQMSALEFNFIYLTQHWLASIGLSSLIAQKSSTAEDRDDFWTRINRFPGRLLTFLIAICFLPNLFLFLSFPKSAGMDKLGFDSLQHLFGPAVLAIAICLEFTILLTHLLWDRKFYRMNFISEIFGGQP